MRQAAALLVLLLAGCPSRAPEAALEAYARALDAGRLDDAYAMTTPEYRAATDRAAFEARFADAETRRAEAARLMRLEDELTLVARVGEGPALLVRTAEGWRILPPEPESLVPPQPVPGAEARAREVVQAFVAAVEKGDFAAVYTLLSRDLRARYSPDRLERDFAGAAPAARDAVGRVQAALDAGTEVVIEGDRGYLPLGGGLAVRLVREDGVWRVAALQ